MLLADADVDELLLGGEAHPSAAKGEHAGLFVCLPLDPLSAERLGLPGYERPEDLHVTLAYVADADSLAPEQLDAVMAGVRDVASYARPLDGVMLKAGRFPASEASDGKDVLVAHPDVPGLEQLQNEIDGALRLAGVDPTSRFGRFVPHTTLAYVEPGTGLRMDLEAHVAGVPLVFDSLLVRAGSAAPVTIPLGASAKGEGFNPAVHPRGKTTPKSRGGSFRARDAGEQAAPAPAVPATPAAPVTAPARAAAPEPFAKVTHGPDAKPEVYEAVDAMFRQAPVGVRYLMNQEGWNVDVRSLAASAKDKDFAGGDVQAGGYTDELGQRIVVYQDNPDRAKWTTGHESGHVALAALAARSFDAAVPEALRTEITNHIRGFIDATSEEGTWSAYVGEHYFQGDIVNTWDLWSEEGNRKNILGVPRPVNENFAEYFAVYMTKGEAELRGKLSGHFSKSIDHFVWLMDELKRDRPTTVKLDRGMMVPKGKTPSKMQAEMQARRRAVAAGQRLNPNRRTVAASETAEQTYTHTIGDQLVEETIEYNPETGEILKRTWRDLPRQPTRKFNPYHEPGGSPEGGRFAHAEGGGGGDGGGATGAATQTPAFKRWFGNSKVVDDEGRPRVVYHGTTTPGIESFRPYTHFGTEAAAHERGDIQENFSRNIVGRPTEPAELVAVYLRIENPLRMPDLAELDSNTGRPLGDVMVEFGGKSPAEQQHLAEVGEEPRARDWDGEEAVAQTLLEMGVINIDEFEEHRSNRAAFELLKAKGYDGVVYENVIEDVGQDSYIIFDPSQVKAVGNRTFDPHSKNIRRSERAQKFNPYHEPAGSPVGGRFASADSGTTETEAGVTSFTGEEHRSQVARDRQRFVGALKKAGVDVVESRIGLGGWQDLESGAVGSEHTWILRYRGNGRATRALAQAGHDFHQQAIITATRSTTSDPEAVHRYRWEFGHPIAGAEADAVVGLARRAGFSGWTVDLAAGTVTVLTVARYQAPEATFRAARQFQRSLEMHRLRARWRVQPVRVTVMQGADFDRILAAKVESGLAREADARGARGAGVAGDLRRPRAGDDRSRHRATEDLDAALLTESDIAEQFVADLLEAEDRDAAELARVLAGEVTTSVDAAPGCVGSTQGGFLPRRRRRRRKGVFGAILDAVDSAFAEIVLKAGAAWGEGTAGKFRMRGGRSAPGPQRMTGKPGETRWVDADHPRGKTTPESTGGSFRPKDSGESAVSASHGGIPEGAPVQRTFGFPHVEAPTPPPPIGVSEENASIALKLSKDPVSNIRNHGGGISVTLMGELADGTKVVIKPASGASSDQPRDNVEMGKDIERQVASMVANNALGGLVDMPVYLDRDFGDLESPEGGPIGRALFYNRRPGDRIGDVGWENLNQDEVDAMALYDAVIGNEDRHPGQGVVDDGHLIALDHDLSFPESNDDTWGNYNSLGYRSDPELTDHERHVLEAFRQNEAVMQQLTGLVGPESVAAMKERVDHFLETGRLPKPKANEGEDRHWLNGGWVGEPGASESTGESAGSGTRTATVSEPTPTASTPSSTPVVSGGHTDSTRLGDTARASDWHHATASDRAEAKSAWMHAPINSRDERLMAEYQKKHPGKYAFSTMWTVSLPSQEKARWLRRAGRRPSAVRVPPGALASQLGAGA